MLIAKVGNNNYAGPVETGKGTKEEPWVNVNTVFLNEKIQLIITTSLISVEVVTNHSVLLIGILII